MRLISVAGRYLSNPVVELEMAREPYPRNRLPHLSL